MQAESPVMNRPGKRTAAYILIRVKSKAREEEWGGLTRTKQGVEKRATSGHRGNFYGHQTRSIGQA